MTVTVTCEWDSQGDLDGDDTAGTALTADSGGNLEDDAGTWAKYRRAELGSESLRLI